MKDADDLTWYDLKFSSPSHAIIYDDCHVCGGKGYIFQIWLIRIMCYRCKGEDNLIAYFDLDDTHEGDGEVFISKDETAIIKWKDPITKEWRKL